MSEVTRIITAKITFIDKGSMNEKEEEAEIVENAVKNVLDADNVVVTDVQDFVMENTSCNGGKE